MSLLFWAQSEDQARCSPHGPRGPFGSLRCPGHRNDLPRQALLLCLRPHVSLPVGSNLASDQRMHVTHLSAHARNRLKVVGCVAAFRFHEASVRVRSIAAAALRAALATALSGACQEPRACRYGDRAGPTAPQWARQFPLKAARVLLRDDPGFSP